MRPTRWVGRRQKAASSVAPDNRVVFEGIDPPAVDDGHAPAPAPVLTDGSPVAVYLSGPDHSWCARRRGVWWPRQGVWVDRLELTTEDVPPAGARTYPLVPPTGVELVDVHGQVDGDGTSHVLVTGPGGQVVTQVSMAGAGPQDRVWLVLATLVTAAGGAQEPTEAFNSCVADSVLGKLGGLDWEAGWTMSIADDLPGRVTGALARVGAGERA